MSGIDKTRHEHVVERLRDVTRNRDALLATAGERLPRAGQPRRRAADAQARATYDTVRGMEDAALKAVAAAYLPARDYRAVTRAIEEAGANWLYAVVLDRVLDGVASGGGDA
jgi:hypothetical protein